MRLKQLTGVRFWAGRRGLIILAIAASLIAAHVSAIQRGDDLVGALLVLDHLFNVALVGALLLLCIAVGQKVLRRLGLENEPPLDRLVFAAGLGAGFVGTLILLLGLLGGLYPALLLAVLAATAWVARLEVAELPLLARAAAGQVRRGMAGHLPILLAALGGLVFVFLVAMALTPPIDWDSLLLHIRVPSQFLAEHRVYVPEDNLPSGFAALIQLLYVPLLAARSESGPALLSAAIALLLGLALLALCLRFFDSEAALLSVAGLWGSGLVLMVAVTPRIDVTLAFFALLTTYALLMALPSARPGEAAEEATTRRARLLFLAALLLGLTMAVKYLGIAFAAALAPLILVAAKDPDEGAQVWLRNLLAFGGVAFLVLLPWIAKNLLLFEAPLFPMFAEPRVPPWLAELYGSHGFPATGDKFSGVVWQLREPFNLRDFFLAPRRISVEAEAGFYFPSPLLLLLPLWIFTWRDRIARWLLVPGLLYIGLLITYRPATNARYLIPGIVVLTIVAAAAATKLLRRGFPAWRERKLVLLLLLLPASVLPAVFAIGFWMTRSDALPHLVGVASPSEYLQTLPAGWILPEMIGEVPRRVPEDGRLLLLFEPRGYYFGEDAVQDSQMNNWPLLVLAPRNPGCLEEFGVTHVLVNMVTLNYRLDRGFDPDDFEWPAFAEFSKRCLDPVYEGGGFTLFRIRA